MAGERTGRRKAAEEGSGAEPAAKKSKAAIEAESAEDGDGGAEEVKVTRITIEHCKS
jgi:hypothetical protein